jgi:DNA-binding MarR family transcriptional regulator
MKDNKISINNIDTDKILEMDLIIATKKKHYEKGAFFVMSKSIADLILTEDNEYELTGMDLKLFFYLLKNAEANNRIKTFVQKEVAAALRTRQPNISRSLKKLIEVGLIEQIEHDYYFNSDFVYTGKKR